MAIDPPEDPLGPENPDYVGPPAGPPPFPQQPPVPQQPPANWAPTQSPVQGGFSVANPGTHYTRNSLATLALVLSLLSYVGLCCITAPAGTILGYLEIKAIDRGETDPSNRGLAVAAVAAGAVALGIMALILFIAVLLVLAGA